MLQHQLINEECIAIYWCIYLSHLYLCRSTVLNNSLCNPTHLYVGILWDVQLFRATVCVSYVQKNREHIWRGPPMPHSERGFSESVMGIMRNMISYGYRMVNLLKPCLSLQAHSCYCPVMEAYRQSVYRQCMMGKNLCVCVLPVGLMGVEWRRAIMDISNYLLRECWHLYLLFNIKNESFLKLKSQWSALSECCSCFMATLTFSCCCCCWPEFSSVSDVEVCAALKFLDWLSLFRIEFEWI